MFHKKSVLSLSFTEDDQLLASGDSTGLIKVWKV